MESNKIFRYFRWVIYFFEIYFLYSIEQTYCYIFISHWNIRPILVVSVPIVISLFEKEFTGMTFGIIAGMFMDMGFGIPFGLCSLAMGLIGYILGVLSNYFMRSNFWISWFICSILIGAVISLRFVFICVLPGLKNANYAWISLYLPIIICSIAFVPLIYLFNRAIFYFVHELGGGQNKSTGF